MTLIPFTRGVPSADLLPVEDIRRAAEAAMREDAVAALSYAPNGHPELRRWIGERHGVAPERVLAVNGSLQGVGFLAHHFFHGDAGVAVVEDPTYDRTLIALRTAGAALRRVPLEPDGIDVDALAEAFDAEPRPRIAYLIPTFQNPAGISLSAGKRAAVVELARDRGVTLIEDDPYGLLRFEGEPCPTLHALDGGDNVIHCSSFTKTIAPGVRTGYLILPERLVAPFTALSANTYIAPNSFAEAVLAAYCRSGAFAPNVERATAELHRRRDAMEAALREHFPAGSRWTTPQGGYFYWVELPEGFDADGALAAATDAGVPYVRGSDFSDRPAAARSLRLAFSAASVQEIGEGIARLAGVLEASRQAAAV